MVFPKFPISECTCSSSSAYQRQSLPKNILLLLFQYARLKSEAGIALEGLCLSDTRVKLVSRKRTYGELRIHVMSEEISCLVDRVVERVRANRIVVSVPNIDTRNSSNRHKRRVVTSGTKRWYSTHNNYNNNSSTVSLFSDLSRRISTVSGDIRDSSYLFQRIAITIQRFNSVLFGDSFLPGDDLDF